MESRLKTLLLWGDKMTDVEVALKEMRLELVPPGADTGFFTPWLFRTDLALMGVRPYWAGNPFSDIKVIFIPYSNWKGVPKEFPWKVGAGGEVREISHGHRLAGEWNRWSKAMRERGLAREENNRTAWMKAMAEAKARGGVLGIFEQEFMVARNLESAGATEDEMTLSLGLPL
jgi:hypothetical protein